jgi:hypothetical protein
MLAELVFPEGHTKREALRSLKRHISRELYHRLEALLTSWKHP